MVKRVVKNSNGLKIFVIIVLVFSIVVFGFVVYNSFIEKKLLLSPATCPPGFTHYCPDLSETPFYLEVAQSVECTFLNPAPPPHPTPGRSTICEGFSLNPASGCVSLAETWVTGMCEQQIREGARCSTIYRATINCGMECNSLPKTIESWRGALVDSMCVEGVYPSGAPSCICAVRADIKCQLKYGCSASMGPPAPAELLPPTTGTKTTTTPVTSPTAAIRS
jgi:hypothetical protein